LNPRPPECKELVSGQFWENFGSWLLKIHRRKHAKEILRYAKRFARAYAVKHCVLLLLTAHIWKKEEY